MKLLQIVLILVFFGFLLGAGNDNNIEWDGVDHNPSANVPNLTPTETYRYLDTENNVTRIWLQVYKGDITSCNVVWRNGFNDQDHYVSMSWHHNDAGGTTYDYWYGEIPYQNSQDLYYVIQIVDGTDVDWAGPGGGGANGVVHEGEPTNQSNWWHFDDTSLPVSLTSFTAQAGNGEVTLQWVTESEVENDAFILERSVDQQNFQPIAEIPGQGNSTVQHVYTYTDREVTNGITYYYRLADRDFNGHLTYHQVISATPMAEGNLNRLGGTIPARFALHPNFPNPFNPSTTIRFDLPLKAEGTYQVKLTVYDLNGHLVKELLHGQYPAGSYQIQWDGTNELGQNVASGVYIYRLITRDGLSATQKMMLIR